MLAFVYRAGRRNSRSIAAAATTAELQLLEQELIAAEAELAPLRPASGPGRGIYRTPARTAGADAEDAWRSRRASRGYAEHWLDDAAELGSSGALDAQAWRLELGAITESADAWAAEREFIIQDYALSNPAAANQLWRVWDATMDKRTCGRCGGAHGTVVRIWEPFPEGRPGAVHPRCRCTEQILTYDEVDLDYYAWAA